MYICLCAGKGRVDGRRIVSHIVFALPDQFISEGDQKKDGKRSKPAKPKPEKPEPEREGDKGKRKVKNPRTEELVLKPA